MVNMQITGRILVVEDDELIGTMLVRALKKAGHKVHYKNNPNDILDKIASWSPDITMLDIKLPGKSGLDILADIKAQGMKTQVVMLTADDSAETSVKAMKLGATDYLTKPFNIDEVLMVLAGILEKEKLRDEVSYFRKQCKERNQKEIIGKAPLTLELISEIKALASAGVDSVLLTGESGTGKELIASHLHQLLSKESQTPLIRINCAALPESLLEAELFGHVKGTFTDALHDKKGLFELADGGCLLLDEIAEMKMELQSKLLRVLEERTIRRVGGHEEIPVSVTVIATTNKNIPVEVQKGTFRLDLFYRLNTFPLHVAPLRDRQNDIMPLAEFFLNHYNHRYKRNAIKGFTKESQQLMLAYEWPGNVRELQNVIERLVVLKSPSLVEPRHLPPEINITGEPASMCHPLRGFTLPEEGIDTEDLEKSLITQAMEQSGNNQKRAASLLHMKYDTFRYKLKKHGLNK
jgi:two-component system, NtrC family, response regulator AtoC